MSRSSCPLVGITDAEWDGDTSGRSADLGKELDMVLGVGLVSQWEVEAVFSYFEPDSAFTDSESAWFGKLQLKLQF